MTSRIIRRAEWDARPPEHRTPMPVPADDWYVHHSGRWYNKPEAQQVRDIQAFHMGPNRNWSDIAYSFIIGQSGSVFEGRGWGIEGGHTFGHNSDGHGVVWLGDFTDRAPSRASLDAFRWLVSEGVRLKKALQEGIVGHRDVVATACPGNKLYARMDYLRKPWKKGVGVSVKDVVEAFGMSQAQLEANQQFIRGQRAKRLDQDRPTDDENAAKGWESEDDLIAIRAKLGA